MTDHKDEEEKDRTRKMRVSFISKSTHPSMMILLRSILLLVLHFQVYLFAGAFARPVAVVTGANRGIGHATAGLLADIGYHVIITARDEAKGQECLELLRQRHHHGAVAGQVKQPSMEFLLLDVTDASKAWQLKVHLQQQGIQAPDVLINNAGICIKTEPQGVETYRQSLDVNTWGPIRLAEVWLPDMLKHRYWLALGHPYWILCTDEDDFKKGCVVNISSGDGELAYLQTSAAKRLRAIRSLEELKEYADKGVEEQRDPKGASIAHTPWHAYSFSKAVLNTATRLMHGQVRAAAAENGGQADRKGVRIYAVCPGDVATGMCDIKLQKALTPAQAALDIAWTILHPEQVPSGGFYRARQRIQCIYAMLAIIHITPSEENQRTKRRNRAQWEEGRAFGERRPLSGLNIRRGLGIGAYPFCHDECSLVYKNWLERMELKHMEGLCDWEA